MQIGIDYAHIKRAQEIAMEHYDVTAPKRSVNLTANSDLLDKAKDLRINLSRAFEEAVKKELRETLEQKWLEENKEAIDAYNARIERNGIFGADKRRF